MVRSILRRASILVLLTTGCATAPPPAVPPLTPQSPARLELEGPDDAVVHVDGTAVARLPEPEPIEVPSGEHLVAVTLEGHEPVARPMMARRGEATRMRVDLEPTAQRITAEVLLGVGSVAIGTGIALGVVAVIEQRRSGSIVDEAGGLANATPAEQADYDTAIARKDTFRPAAGVVLGTGMLVFITGGLLFVLDEAEPPKEAAGEDAFEVTPVVDGDGAGLWTTVRF